MEWIDSILGAFSKNPDVSAAILGIFLSWCATQFFKKLTPAEWSETKYRRAVQVTGFATGLAFTHGAWMLLDPTSTHFERAYMSAGCGFASPALYSLIIPFVTAKFGAVGQAIGKALSGRPSENS